MFTETAHTSVYQSEPPPASTTRPATSPTAVFEPPVIRLTPAQEFAIHAIAIGRREDELAASFVAARGVPRGLAKATATRVLGALLRKGAIVRDLATRSGYRVVPMRTPAERLTERNRQLDELEGSVAAGRLSLRAALTAAAGIGARLGG